jgi:hypothetical protein
MYSIKPIYWNFKSVPASPGRSRVGPALYIFSLLGADHAVKPEPEFLNILKCIPAESASTGFSLIVIIFLMIKHLIIGIWTTFQVC